MLCELHSVTGGALVNPLALTGGMATIEAVIVVDLPTVWTNDWWKSGRA